MWQAQDPENRQYALSGTPTTLNIPPSPNVTLDDYLSWVFWVKIGRYEK